MRLSCAGPGPQLLDEATGASGHFAGRRAQDLTSTTPQEILMSNNTDGSTRSKATRAKTAAPAPAAPALSEAFSDVAWVADEQTRDAMIRLAAYTFYERRGHVYGSDLEDWLEAEMEVDRQLSASQPAGHASAWAPEHAHAIAPLETRARMHAPSAAKPAKGAPANFAQKAAPKAAVKAGSTKPPKARKAPEA